MRTGWDRYKEYGITLLRVALGVYYLLHAYYGWAVFGVENLARLNANMGVPFPGLSAWAVVLGHLAGGALLALGFYARLGALFNIPIMAGAVFLVHFKQGFFMTWIVVDAARGRAIAGGYEYSLFLLIATVAVLFLGSGPLVLRFPSRRPAPISLD